MHRILALTILALALAGCADRSPPMTVRPLTAAGEAERLQAAGLPLSEVYTYTAEVDPLIGRPSQYVEKVSWADPRVQAPRATDHPTVTSGGSLERFATPADLAARWAHLEAVATGPLLGEYRYRDDQRRLILRVALSLTPDQAAEYERAFRA